MTEVASLLAHCKHHGFFSSDREVAETLQTLKDRNEALENELAEMPALREAHDTLTAAFVQGLTVEVHPECVKVLWPKTQVPLRLIGAEPLTLAVSMVEYRMAAVLMLVQKALGILERERLLK